MPNFNNFEVSFVGIVARYLVSDSRLYATLYWWHYFKRNDI